MKFIICSVIVVCVKFISAQNPTAYRFNELNLPVPVVCGTDDKKVSAIDDPWSAMIKYSMKDEVESRLHCDGLLINDKYILTAAHCLNSSNLMRFGLHVSSVRLGVNIRSSNCKIGCEHEVDVPIDEIVTHEKYSLNERHNDIALIRLTQTIRYSKYVKPICLPFAQHLRHKNYDDSILTAIGFGEDGNDGRQGVFKLKQMMPGHNLNECSKIYTHLGFELNGSQLCAGEMNVEDNCDALPGKSLIADDTSNGQKRYKYLVGIYSFGIGLCGNSGFPGVYTRVDQHLDWILEHMKP